MGSRSAIIQAHAGVCDKAIVSVLVGETIDTVVVLIKGAMPVPTENPIVGVMTPEGIVVGIRIDNVVVTVTPYVKCSMKSVCGNNSRRVAWSQLFEQHG